MMETVILTDEHRLWLEENYSRMYAFALSQLRDQYAAEDAVCDAAAVIITKYGTRRGDFAPWAWGILRKIILRAERRRCRFMREDDIESYAENLADFDTLPPAENLITAHERGQVRRILSMMPADIRRVLEERYISERSYTEIADILEIPLSSVTWRLHEGKKQMRKEWDFMELDTYMKDGYYAPVDLKIDVRWRKKVKKSEMHIDSLREIHSTLGSLIAKNIAVVCYDSPKTVTDISRIMGVPAVYIEEVLAKLLEAELVKQISNRYQTAFPIIGSKRFCRMKALCAEKCGGLYEKWADELIHVAENTFFSSALNHDKLTMEQKVYILLFAVHNFGRIDPFSDDGSLMYPIEKGEVSMCVKAYSADIDPEEIFPLKNFFCDFADSSGNRTELHFEEKHGWLSLQEPEKIDALIEEIRSDECDALLFTSLQSFISDSEAVRGLAKMQYEDQLRIKDELVKAVLLLLPERFRAFEAYVNCELRNFISAGFEEYLIAKKRIEPAAYVIHHVSVQENENKNSSDDRYTCMY